MSKRFVLAVFALSAVASANRHWHRPSLANLKKKHEYVVKQRDCDGEVERKDVVRKYATLKNCNSLGVSRFPGVIEWMKNDQYDYEWPQVRIDTQGTGDPYFLIEEVVGYQCIEADDTFYYEAVE